MTVKMIAAGLIAAAGLAQAAVAAPLEIGIGTHFGHSAGNLTIVQGFYPSPAGLGSIRDDVSWGQSEFVQNQITLRDGGPKLQNLLRTPKLTIPRPMLILSYANQYYDGGGRPTSDQGRDAFARFAGTILPYFPSTAYVEIGNEWNIGDVGRGMAADYTKLVKAAIPAIRRLDKPRPKIIVGALADDYPDWAFAKQLIAGGALDGVDGLSVHLYNHCKAPATQVTAEEMGNRLDTLRHQMGDAYANLPIYVTEFGWPVKGSCPVSEQIGALNTLRFLLEASGRPGVGGVWIYDMLNDGTLDTADTRESSFGLVRQTKEISNTGNAALWGDPNFPVISDEALAAATKPMGCVMKDPLVKQIGLRPQTIAKTSHLNSAVFNDDGKQAIVIWSPTTYPATTPSGSIKVYGADGNALSARTVCGGVAGGAITSATSDGANGILHFTLDGGHPLVIEVAGSSSVTAVELQD